MATTNEIKNKAEEVASALHFTENETVEVLNLIRRIEENLLAGRPLVAKLDADEIGAICSGKAWSDYQVAVMNEFRRMLEDWIESEVEFYMISPSGFDIAAVLEVFWKRLKYTSPTELELSLRDIVDEVEMTAERKEGVVGIMRRMVALGLVDKYRR